MHFIRIASFLNAPMKFIFRYIRWVICEFLQYTRKGPGQNLDWLGWFICEFWLSLSIQVGIVNYYVPPYTYNLRHESVSSDVSSHIGSRRRYSDSSSSSSSSDDETGVRRNTAPVTRSQSVKCPEGVCVEYQVFVKTRIGNILILFLSHFK